MRDEINCNFIRTGVQPDNGLDVYNPSGPDKKEGIMFSELDNELKELGKLLTATSVKDVKRLDSINKRVNEICTIASFFDDPERLESVYEEISKVLCQYKTQKFSKACEPIKKLVVLETGVKYSYFEDPETGKFYRPKDGLEIFGADLSDRFVEVEP